MANQTYKIIEEGSELSNVIRSIPNDWASLDGFLIAPNVLYERDRIAGNTRLEIGKQSCSPAYRSVQDVPFEKYHWENSAPGTSGKFCELESFVLQGKFPSSILFQSAGYNGSQVELSAALAMTRGFVELGYRGWFSVYSGFFDDILSSPREIFFASHIAGTVKAEWNPEYGGKRKNLVPILAAIVSESFPVLGAWP